ncbi:MAG TPA: glycogen synthase GlgA [Thermoanaerobaculia bacterium]|jgi:starch synthase|nr:glycogen synthase GlgA [Thermoanaerobaculia bacterium]
MRILFASAEVSPVAKTGGLGDVCGSLPKALRRLGHDVAIFMPFYRQAREWFAKNGVEPEPISETFALSWADWVAEIRYWRTSLPGTDIPLLLVENAFLFDRPQIYAARPDGYDDYLERYAVFCRAVIRGCEQFAFAPDVVHAHDWHAALLPVYLHSGLRGSDAFRNAHSVFTIHNLHYQGVASVDRFRHLGLHSRYWAPDALEHFGDLNPMKGGIILADQVTTVSPNYANEIRTPEHGAGLDGVLRLLSWKLTGILNGIDVEEWDPSTDPLLEASYEAGKLHGKTINKRMLAREAGFKYKAKTPLIGIISRLVEQKGFQLLIPVLHKLLGAGAQFAILGSGEPRFEEAFARIAEQRKDACRAWLTFDNALAHRIYAGADMLLMPSIYEPCGLNQMYALRYGTLPIVRLTGGLADTVEPFDGTNKEEANGFGFLSASSSELYLATWLGMLNHKDARLWKTLQANGMGEDFSWERSARQYEDVYRRAGAA